jgi:hypothetical protein
MAGDAPEEISRSLKITLEGVLLIVAQVEEAIKSEWYEDAITHPRYLAAICSTLADTGGFMWMNRSGGEPPVPRGAQ